ncbi:hypothetical protein DM02DRAFT_516311 [Periconia macrospinosa]|uniref:CENP-V/GFA domain-containing protein n=1 Tax=Periconia macrospinosa TaxID=97972 RepID=A0A2V1E4N5_9PLEO|nr:hypothetical protein DM02DRAFT_516311 [Periconia macrospinosa]
MAANDTSIELTARCLCKAHNFSTHVPISKLPLLTSACHCDSCRHLTGALYTCDAHWPKPRAKVDVTKLSVFRFSSNYDVLFCGTCSTPMFFAKSQKPDEELGVFSGTIDSVDADVLKITHHIFVGDTKDGGATMWMRRLNNNESEAYHSKTKDPVSIQCKCKGVNFVWNRGDYSATKKEDLPEFIDPTTLKPFAGFCACNSCRLFAGTDVWTYALSELKHISFPSPSSTPFPESTLGLKALVDAKDPSIGTLAYYASSPKVQRYFCSRCSASVFYVVDDRPGLIDVAVGLLRAADGARAERILSWDYGYMSHMEDAADGWRHSFLVRVAKECEDWRVDRGYPESWRRTSREAKSKQ